MSSEVLDKVKQLPLDKQQEVSDFIDFLLHKYQSGNGQMDLAEKRKNNMGWAKGKIFMAEDFNETPEDFKDYM